jgi:hypothetical protein
LVQFPDANMMSITQDTGNANIFTLIASVPVSSTNGPWSSPSPSSRGGGAVQHLNVTLKLMSLYGDQPMADKVTCIIVSVVQTNVNRVWPVR